uniref:Uncharacterized protein n=1 Tax=Avena sativa TaxID=4498 RepID=A0ACD5X214_AVESA
MQPEEFRDEIRSMIRDEIQSFCRKNPDQFTRSLDNPDTIKNPASMAEARKLDITDRSTTGTSKDMESADTSSTSLQSQAMMYARLNESPEIKMSSKTVSYGEQFRESNGLLNVLPISAESAGLLPSRTDEPKGSDLLLEAVLEAEVAENAKFFVSQPHDQLPKE